MGPGIIFAVATLALLGFGIASARKAPAVDVDALKNKAIEALKSGSAATMQAVAAELEGAGVLAETASALRAAAAKLEGKPGAAIPGVTPPGMSPELKKQVEDLLVKETRPEVLEQVAAALEAKGYQAAAMALRAKAKTLKAAGATADVLTQIVDVLQGKPPGTTPPPPAEPVPAPPPAKPPAAPPAVAPPAAPTTYRIKAGDVPYLVAQRFTGNANRWKEIPAANPGMVVKQVTNPKTGKVTTLLDPWYAGLTINLPAGWAKPAAPAPAPTPPAPAPGAAPPPPPEAPAPGVPGVTPPPGWPAALPYPPPKPVYWPEAIPYPPPLAKPDLWPGWLAWPPAPPPGWPLTVPFPPPAPGAAPAPGAPPAVPSTYKIKAGDLPYLVAKKLTGDANRWKEIPGANPGMKIVTKAGVTMLQPWYPGLTINLPASWGAVAQAAAA